MPVPAIEAINLTKQFDKKLAVDQLNLQIAEGEYFGFLGPNGAGKSTTIKMLVGLLRPTAGTVRIRGVDIWEDPLAAKQQLGVLPEGLNLYERLKGREFIRFAGTMYGLDESIVRQRADELLDLMALTEDADKLIIDYSSGMRKKTALAAAIIHTPRVLFLDEPFEGIDAVTGRVIRNVLRQLTEQGTTIFFSSHILEVVERLCSRLAVINKGQLVAEGTIAELRQRAVAGDDVTLEDLFLRAVGAGNQDGEGERKLSWLG
jgi:ABC-2 type transport system ATP-binding protein